MNEQDAIKKFWLNVTAYYRQTVPNEIIMMYAYDCRDVTVEELRRAFETYRTSAEAKFFPIPAVLKNIIRPPFDEDAEANEVVARITHCLSPFKNANDAKESMGELAWEVVRGLGGWSEFGRRPAPDGFAMRDMREMAKSKIVRARQGRTDELPSIGMPNRTLIAAPASQPVDSTASRLSGLVSDTLNGKSLN